MGVTTQEDSPYNRRRLGAYLGEIRSLLRMDNWDIVLHEGVLEDDATHAETWQHENHHVINIRISPDFFMLEPAGVRNTVIHELIHAQHRDVSRIWDRARNCDGVPIGASVEWDEDFRIYMERFVAWVADRLEDQFPLWDPTVPVPKEQPEGVWIHGRPS